MIINVNPKSFFIKAKELNSQAEEYFPLFAVRKLSQPKGKEFCELLYNDGTSVVLDTTLDKIFDQQVELEADVNDLVESEEL